MNADDFSTKAYVRVIGDCLKESNDDTRRKWEEALEEDNGYPAIVECGVKNEEKTYLIRSDVYMNLIYASTEKGDPYGIVNVNFSIIDPTDDRWEKYKEQRMLRGFDNSELWNLDNTIAKFIYPRLQAFRENNNSYPHGMSEKKWHGILDDMIKAFYSLAYVDTMSLPNVTDMEKENAMREKGLKLFAKWFQHLWD